VTPPAQVAAAATQTEANARPRRAAWPRPRPFVLSDLKGRERRPPVQDVPEDKRPAKLVGISGNTGGGAGPGSQPPSARPLPTRTISRSSTVDLRKHLAPPSRQRDWKGDGCRARNGVRVNGESYAQIGLRHGDTLEWGTCVSRSWNPAGRSSFARADSLAGRRGSLAASPHAALLGSGSGMARAAAADLHLSAG